MCGRECRREKTCARGSTHLLYIPAGCAYRVDSSVAQSDIHVEIRGYIFPSDIGDGSLSMKRYRWQDDLRTWKPAASGFTLKRADKTESQTIHNASAKSIFVKFFLPRFITRSYIDSKDFHILQSRHVRFSPILRLLGCPISNTNVQRYPIFRRAAAPHTISGTRLAFGY